MAAHTRGSGAWIIGLWAALGAAGGARETRAGEGSFEGLPREEALAWQAALEARRFSPGLLDGIPGARTEAALRGFQIASGLAATGAPDEA
ncbi:MAG TPA: peptidoglycan-binding domain-containing protein, partial [Planctomycetota bacterium]|nr:peptidoglycan-binding domain-containing protein [Planctomycetota bacterium]